MPNCVLHMRFRWCILLLILFHLYLVPVTWKTLQPIVLITVPVYFSPVHLHRGKMWAWSVLNCQAEWLCNVASAWHKLSCHFFGSKCREAIFLYCNIWNNNFLAPVVTDSSVWYMLNICASGAAAGKNLQSKVLSLLANRSCHRRTLIFPNSFHRACHSYPKKLYLKFPRFHRGI